MPPRRTTQVNQAPAKPAAAPKPVEEMEHAGGDAPKIVIHMTEIRFNLGLPFVVGGSFFADRPSMSMLRRFFGGRVPEPEAAPEETARAEKIHGKAA